jgi:hypothetical protein
MGEPRYASFTHFMNLDYKFLVSLEF